MARKGRIIEGFWNCQYCGTKKIRGGLRECPNCGKPRGIGTKFEMDMVNPNYVKPEIAKTISKNPDWLCSFCESLNNDNDCNCISCGASKEDSEKNYFQMKAEKEKKEQAIRDEEEKLNEEYEDMTSDLLDEILEDVEENHYTSSDSCEEISTYKINNKNQFNFLTSVCSFVGDFVKNINPMVIIGALASVLLIVGFIWLLIPKEDTLTVSQIKWERSISIEEERTVKEDGWSVPIGGRTYKTTSEIHHYDQVLDHYETVTETKTRQVVTGYEDYVSGYRDLGNGYFEEIISSRPVYGTETYTETRQEPVYISVPVYQTYYYYEIEKWFHCRSIDTSGEDKNPYWGEVSLGIKEREGSKSERYIIIATNKDGEVNNYTLNFSDWETINIGDVLKVKVYLFNQIEILDKNGDVISKTE